MPFCFDPKIIVCTKVNIYDAKRIYVVIEKGYRDFVGNCSIQYSLDKYNWFTTGSQKHWNRKDTVCVLKDKKIEFCCDLVTTEKILFNTDYFFRIVIDNNVVAGNYIEITTPSRCLDAIPEDCTNEIFIKNIKCYKIAKIKPVKCENISIAVLPDMSFNLSLDECVNTQYCDSVKAKRLTECDFNNLINSNLVELSNFGFVSNASFDDCSNINDSNDINLTRIIDVSPMEGIGRGYVDIATAYRSIDMLLDDAENSQPDIEILTRAEVSASFQDNCGESNCESIICTSSVCVNENTCLNKQECDFAQAEVATIFYPVEFKDCLNENYVNLPKSSKQTSILFEDKTSESLYEEIEIFRQFDLSPQTYTSTQVFSTPFANRIWDIDPINIVNVNDCVLPECEVDDVCKTDVIVNENHCQIEKVTCLKFAKPKISDSLCEVKLPSCKDILTVDFEDTINHQSIKPIYCNTKLYTKQQSLENQSFCTSPMIGTHDLFLDIATGKNYLKSENIIIDF